LNLPVYLYTPAIRVFLDLENSTKRGVDMMYHGYVRIAKGITNTIRFNFVNGDQRTIPIRDNEFVFMLFDSYTNKELLSKSLTILEIVSGLGENETVIQKGQAELVIEHIDTCELIPGNYTYSIVRKDPEGKMHPVFVDGASRMHGEVLLDDGILPKFIPSEELKFGPGQDNLYSAGPIAANRDGRGNISVTTFLLYFINFTGNFKIYVTLDNSSSNPNWVEIVNVDYVDQNGPVPTPITLNQPNVTYYRFEYTPTSGSIDKIVFRR
jgi:hypothetical protein